MNNIERIIARMRSCKAGVDLLQFAEKFLENSDEKVIDSFLHDSGGNLIRFFQDKFEEVSKAKPKPGGAGGASGADKLLWTDKVEERKGIQIMAGEETKGEAIEPDEVLDEKECWKRDIIEARDIALNTDFVVQYEAPFRVKEKDENGKWTGKYKIEYRKWLAVNAWKLGLRRFVDNGFGYTLKYSDSQDDEGRDIRVCDLKLTKGEQVIEVRWLYTKGRIKSFLDPSREECFDTFSLRNALKKLVSVEDVAEMVTRAMKKLEAMPKPATRLALPG